MSNGNVTTRAVSLTDETWDLLAEVTRRQNGKPDLVLERLIREGANAYADRWPSTFGSLKTT